MINRFIADMGSTHGFGDVSPAAAGGATERFWFTPVRVRVIGIGLTNAYYDECVKPCSKFSPRIVDFYFCCAILKAGRKSVTAFTTFRKIAKEKGKSEISHHSGRAAADSARAWHFAHAVLTTGRKGSAGDTGRGVACWLRLVNMNASGHEITRARCRHQLYYLQQHLAAARSCYDGASIACDIVVARK